MSKIVLKSNGSDIIELHSGKMVHVKLKNGLKYHLLKSTDGVTESDPSSVIVTRQDNALKLYSDDGTSIILDDFFVASNDSSSITLPSNNDVYTISSSNASGDLLFDNGHVVYVYGDSKELVSFFNIHDLESFKHFDNFAYYIPPENTVAGAWYSDNLPLLGGVILAGGAVALASGHSSSSSSSPQPTVLNGNVVAGPVLNTNDLQVVAYRADGTVLVSGQVSADGTFSLNVPTGYTGNVLVKVFNSNTNPDYFDEATGQPKDLSTDLRAATVIPSPGTYNVNLNVLTELATRMMGVSDTNLTGITGQQINEANQSVADAVGLGGQDLITGTAPNAIIDTSGAANVNSNDYGRLLAALSGAEVGSDTNTILNDLLSEITNGTLSTNGISIFVAGAAAVGGFGSELIDQISNLTNKITTISIDTISDDNSINSTDASAPLNITGTCEAGASVVITIEGVSYTATVTGTQWSVTLSPSDLSGWNEGAVNVHAESTVNSVNALTNRGVFVDTISPTTTFSALDISDDTGSSDSDFITHIASQTVTATLSAALLTSERVLGSVDGGTTWTDITSMVNGTTLTWTDATLNGISTIKLKVIDSAGNVGTIATQNYELDTAAPVASAALNYDDNISNVINSTSTASSTNDTRPGINIGTGLSDIPSLYIDGVKVNATYDSVAGVLTPDNDLLDDTYDFTYTLTDSAGNEGNQSPALTITIDTVAPAAPLNAPVDYADDAGRIVDNASIAAITDDTRPGINIGTGLSDTPALYIDGVKVDATYDPITGTLTPDNALSDATYEFTYTLIDAAGNESGESSGLTIIINSVGPTTTISGLSFSDDTGSSNSDFITSAAPQTISATLSAALASDELLYGSLDNGLTWTDITSMVSGTSVNWTGVTLTESSTLKLVVSFTNGNDGTVTSQPYEYDTSAASPTIALLNDNGIDNNDLLTNDPTLDLGIEVGAAVEYSTDGGYTWVSSFTAVEGSNTVRIRQTDLAGNVSEASSDFTFTLDTTAPTTTVSGLSFSDDTGSSNSDFITSAAPQTISATLSAALASDELLYGSLDNGLTWTDITSMVSGTSVNWTGVTLTESSTLKLVVRDTAGNDSTIDSQVYEYDTTVIAPILALLNDTGSSTTDLLTNDDTLNPSGEIGATFEYSVDNGTTWSSSFTAVEGLNTVIARQTDVAGNVSEASSDFTFTLDTIAPDASTTTSSQTNSNTPAIVSSTEIGMAYLVDSTLTPTSIADILAYADAQYNSVAITAENTNTNLSVTGLAQGTYKLYTSDAAGNLSDASSTTIDVGPLYTPGDAVINTHSYWAYVPMVDFQLIDPFLYNGEYYYFVNKYSLDSVGTSLDTYQYINATGASWDINNDISGNDRGSSTYTTTTYRYGTIGDVNVALATLSELQGIRAANGGSIPSGWAMDVSNIQYWTADETAGNDHMAYRFSDGSSSSWSFSNGGYAIVKVLPA